MRDDVIRARLVESNPWWKAAASGIDPTAWADVDPVLRARQPFDLGYRPTILSDIALGPVDDKLVILRGPRRVGKSVLLKDTIAALCQRPDVDPRQVIYLATDTMKAADLNRVASLGRDLTRSIDPAPRIWLLDEITSIRDWTATIKYLRDNTALSNDTVICTGSSWDHSAEVERDLLAGRAGRTSTHRLRLLLPMTFREIVVVTGRAVPLPPSVAPWDMQNADVAAALDQAEFFTEQLDLAWQSYLTSGGFPRAVGEHHRDGLVSEAFVGDLVAWLHRDVDPDEPADSVALLLAELTRRSTSPLNRTDTAQILGYPNRQSFDRRLARLVDSFAALWCHQINDTGSRIPGSQSKLYLSDPLLAWLGSRVRAGLRSPDFTQLTENAIGAAMARAIDNLQPGRWHNKDTIGYLRTTNGKEVDLAPCPVPTTAGRALTTPVECKWVTQGWQGEAKVIEGRYNHGIIATRNIVDHNRTVWAMPAPLLALLLG
jgi:uncharacterized protein